MIEIIGRGNVAFHLQKALNKETEAILVNPHTLEESGLNSDNPPELILLAVSDDAIPEVAEKIKKLLEASEINKNSGLTIAHTAGSVPISTLRGITKNFGVFYPLQTFSKNNALDYSEIPVFIEASNPETLNYLKKIAFLFSKNVREADSEARKTLHLASVFACNFTNALAGIAENILSESGIEFSALLPLMKQTVRKLETMTPSEAQTGPAVRGDRKVMEAHLRMLDSKPELQHLYQTLSTLIKPLNS